MGNGGCKGTEEGIFMVCLQGTRFFQAGILPVLLTSYPPQCLTQSRLSVTTWRMNMCVYGSVRGLVALNKKVQREEMMLEKLGP